MRASSDKFNHLFVICCYLKHFETNKERSDFVGPFRDLQDQVHPNANGQMKQVRLYANKIRSRFLY